MKITRRSLLAGAAASGILARDAEAAPPSGQNQAYAIAHGWNTLPLGCGGLVTGFYIAPDGTMVCRTDVGNIYRWSGTTGGVVDPTQKWQPLLTFSSLGVGAKQGSSIGAYEHVLAPSKTTNHYAIFCDMTGKRIWWLWYSTNSGATWAKTNVSLLNAGSNNNPYGSAYYKIAVDPANENVVYCGMPTGSGNSCSVYRATDGKTFHALTTDGSAPFPQTTVGSGVCGICFDTYHGTTTVGGQLRTKRIIIPVSGVGMYETLDGGQTFTEVAVNAFGTSNFYVFNGAVNFYGVYYTVARSGTNRTGHLWRYSGPAGKWAMIDPPQTPSYIGGCIVIPDTRASHAGFLNLTGPNGFGAGYTSHDADTGSPPNWGGRTGGEIPSASAPSYDVGYLNYVAGQGHRNAYLGGTAGYIDSNGVCWWSGNQGFWYFKDMPDYGASIYTISVSVSRGMEATVAQDTLCPPGGEYPVLGHQDLGLMRGTFNSYPKDQYPRYKALCCENLEYAASDPSFIVARLTGQTGNEGWNDYSCYSTNYGADGSWTGLATYPTSLYKADVAGDISNGLGGKGSILNVTEVNSGTVRIGQEVYNRNAYYGQITSFGSGSGGVGTYNLSAQYYSASASLSLKVQVQGGHAVAVDHDHWVMVPATWGQYNVCPAYTANAKSRSCSWSLTNLPFGYWMLRGWSFGSTTKPLAVGYGKDLGTVWAVYPSANGKNPTGKLTLYRSTDYGATYSSIATISVSQSLLGLVLLSVPGFPGELWLCPFLTGGSPNGLWHITDANSSSPTISHVTPPQPLPLCFTLGAPAVAGGYPTLYGLFWPTYGAEPKLYKGTYSRGSISWSIFGPTGTRADLPKSCQLCGIQSIRADWNVYERLYVASNQSGFAYYNP